MTDDIVQAGKSGGDASTHAGAGAGAGAVGVAAGGDATDNTSIGSINVNS